MRFYLQGSQKDRVYMDQSHLPICFLCYTGHMSEHLFRQAFTFRKRLTSYLHLRDTGLVSISNLDNAKVPKPTVRSVVAELSADDINEKGLIANITVVRSPIFRGAMTAINWLLDDSEMPFLISPNYADAIVKANDIYAKKELAPPQIDAEAYSFPDFEAFESVKVRY